MTDLTDTHELSETRYVRPVGYPGVPDLGIEHIAPLHQVSVGNFTNIDIADTLHTSIASVERSFSRLYEYFETESRVSVWLGAIEQGMIRGPRRTTNLRQTLDLSTSQSDLLYLLYNEDEYTHEELANTLGITTNQVRKQLENLYGQLPRHARLSRLGAVVTAIQYRALPKPKERFDLFTGYLDSPLSDYQTRILGVLAVTDMSQSELAKLANTSPQSVNGAVIKARRKIGTASTSELIGMGIKDKWLPEKNYRLESPRFEVIEA